MKSSSIACDVLTGFLGSGKSTLLNAFLRTAAGPRTAVIVNEFGEIGIDQFMFQELAEGVYLLDSGCLCCTVTHSLSATLLDIQDRVSRIPSMRLDRIVIETTGLADPLPILHALLGDRSINQAFHLRKVITAVDAVQGREQLARHEESARQAALADHIVLTKIDMIERSSETELLCAIRLLNPSASIYSSAADQPAVGVFEQPGPASRPKHGATALESSLNAAARMEHEDEHSYQDDHTAPNRLLHGHDHAHDHDDDAHGEAGISSWSTYIEGPITWVGIAAWWSLLINRFGKDLLRCKGLLRLSNGEFVRLQGVGTFFHSPQRLAVWPDVNDARSRLVCIGTGMDKAWLDQSLSALVLKDPASKPATLEDLQHCE